MVIDLISATRYDEVDFWRKSALGQSLARFADDSRLVTHIAYENSRGLPTIYNQHIAERAQQAQSDISLFIHDDIWLDDIFWVDRLIDGLKKYDVVGLAGNKRRVKNQPAWCFVQDAKTGQIRRDQIEFLSGSVAHGMAPNGIITRLGASDTECELIDGLFIAASNRRLAETELYFDPRFAFHFYDLDFCRAARRKKLRIGTWPISVTHQSEGGFGSESWYQSYKTYLQKWGD